jgi:hypothetical protein
VVGHVTAVAWLGLVPIAVLVAGWRLRRDLADGGRDG